MSELKDVSGGEWEATYSRQIGESLFCCDIQAQLHGPRFEVAEAYGRTPKEALANARLMAAAKDMAEALRKARRYLHAESVPTADFLEMRDSVDDALKKAGAA